MATPEEKDTSAQHPTVTEHPEQRRQEETGREDPEEVSDIGRPPSESNDPADRKPQTKNPGKAA